MPLYCVKFTIPPNTPIDNPYQQTFEFKQGVLDIVRIRIPPGHGGLAGLKIFYGDKQIIPYNEDGWILGENEVIEWRELYLFFDDPTRLTFRGYNLDESYEHTFIVYFVVMPFEVFFGAYLQKPIEASIEKLLE